MFREYTRTPGIPRKSTSPSSRPPWRRLFLTDSPPLVATRRPSPPLVVFFRVPCRGLSPLPVGWPAPLYMPRVAPFCLPMHLLAVMTLIFQDLGANLALQEAFLLPNGPKKTPEASRGPLQTFIFLQNTDFHAGNARIPASQPFCV